MVSMTTCWWHLVPAQRRQELGSHHISWGHLLRSSPCIRALWFSNVWRSVRTKKSNRWTEEKDLKHENHKELGKEIQDENRRKDKEYKYKYNISNWQNNTCIYSEIFTSILLNKQEASKEKHKEGKKQTWSWISVCILYRRRYEDITTCRCRKK